MKINLYKELTELCNRNRDGSYSTQYNRKKILTKAAKELENLGFYNLSTKGLKPKHIEALIESWKEQKLSAGTIKNRMSHLRWWASKVNKQSIIARDNDRYGIDRRQYVTNKTKAVELSNEQISNLCDKRIKCSVELQRAFGLRREESLKFQPSYAIKEKSIILKASWTKGGRAREIPITNDYQREVLERASEIAGNGSMIPKGTSFRNWLNTYTTAIANADMAKLHGLRHSYAQKRFRELTGFDCPACGGPISKELTPEQRKVDRSVRLLISKELGHEREQITAVYLGR